MASKRHVRRKACAGKRVYDTYIAALAVASRQGLRVYHCQFCGHYHVGHTPALVRRIMYLQGKR